MEFSQKNTPHSPSYSFWEYDTWFRDLDLLVVGGGITGCLTAYFYKQRFPSAKILVVDKDPLPRGATLRNAGFLCFGSVSEYLDDAAKHSSDYAAALMKDRFEGLQILKALFETKDIGLKINGGYEVFMPSETEVFEKCLYGMREVNQIFGNNNAFKVTLNPELKLGLAKDHKVIENELEANIHSGKLVREIYKLLQASGIGVLHGISICKMENIYDGVVLDSSYGTFKAREVVVATNAFTRDLLPELNVYPNRGQIVVTTPLPHFKRTGNFHYDAGYFYLRHLEDGSVLLGGGRNLDRENEQTSDLSVSPLIQNALEKILREVFLVDEDFSIAHRWSGVMAFGSENEKAPLVGTLGNIHYIVRMGGMGVAMAPITAKRFVESL